MSRHGQQPGWAGGQKGEPGWDTTASSRNQGAPSCPEGGAKARPPGLPSAWPTGALGCEPWCQPAWGGAGRQGQWGGPETPLPARPTAEAHCPNPAPRRLLYEDTVLTVGSPDHPAEQKAEVSPDSPPQREPTKGSAPHPGCLRWAGPVDSAGIVHYPRCPHLLVSLNTAGTGGHSASPRTPVTASGTRRGAQASVQLAGPPGAGQVALGGADGSFARGRQGPVDFTP